jgi:large subunit ribosomal protein L25
MKLKAESRNGQGRRPCHKLREQGFYPAVLYGKGESSTLLQINKSDLESFMKRHAVMTKPFSLDLDGKTFSVLIKEIKSSIPDNSIQHIDFCIIAMNKPIVVSLSLRFINEDSAKGVSVGGTIEHTLHEIEISALPKHIPSAIEVDLEKVELGQVLHVSDLILPKGCSLAKAVDDGYNPVMVSIQLPKAEKESEPEVVSEVEPSKGDA